MVAPDLHLPTHSNIGVARRSFGPGVDFAYPLGHTWGLLKGRLSISKLQLKKTTWTFGDTHEIQFVD
jgi:hypothetical protein